MKLISVKREPIQPRVPMRTTVVLELDINECSIILRGLSQYRPVMASRVSSDRAQKLYKDIKERIDEVLSPMIKAERGHGNAADL